MSEAKVDTTLGRKARTIEDEIAAQREKLKRLEEKKKELQRLDRERNQKAVLDLIRAERLDNVPAEKWRQAMPKLKVLLDAGPVKSPASGRRVHRAATAEAALVGR